MPGLEKMNLKWYALPAVSAMSLEIGGLIHTCTVQWLHVNRNWSKDFTDQDRYNLIEDIAASMGITNMSNRELWKDKVQNDNRAILHSFEQDGVRMMDHHTLSEWFLKFERMRKKDERCMQNGHGLKLPIGASATPLSMRPLGK